MFTCSGVLVLRLLGCLGVVVLGVLGVFKKSETGQKTRHLGNNKSPNLEWWAKGVGLLQGWAPKGGAPKGGAPQGWGRRGGTAEEWGPEGWGTPRVGAPKGGVFPKGGGPRRVFSLLGVVSWNFGGV